MRHFFFNIDLCLFILFEVYHDTAINFTLKKTHLFDVRADGRTVATPKRHTFLYYDMLMIIILCGVSLIDIDQ